MLKFENKANIENINFSNKDFEDLLIFEKSDLCKIFINF